MAPIYWSMSGWLWNKVKRRLDLKGIKEFQVNIQGEGSMELVIWKVEKTEAW
jgi:hypothetical protein